MLRWNQLLPQQKQPFLVGPISPFCLGNKSCLTFSTLSKNIWYEKEIADIITMDTGKTTADAMGSVQRGLRMFFLFLNGDNQLVYHLST